jgi:hypothetical protein
MGTGRHLAKQPILTAVPPAPEPEDRDVPVDLLRLESEFGVGTAAISIAGNTFLATVPLVPRVEHGDTGERIRERTREDYCRPAEDVKRELRERLFGTHPREGGDAARLDQPTPPPNTDESPGGRTPRERWITPEPDDP